MVGLTNANTGDYKMFWTIILIGAFITLILWLVTYDYQQGGMNIRGSQEGNKDMRRLVLWLTGRDLLEPVLPELKPPASWRISWTPEPRWEITFSEDSYLKFFLPTGPNVLHRMAQRFMLGIRWRIIAHTPPCISDIDPQC